MTTKAKKAATNTRSANPDAIRLTVYLPPKLHGKLVKRTVADRAAARKQSTGPRTVKRVTLSDTTVRAVEAYLG